MSWALHCACIPCLFQPRFMCSHCRLPPTPVALPARSHPLPPPGFRCYDRRHALKPLFALEKRVRTLACSPCAQRPVCSITPFFRPFPAPVFTKRLLNFGRAIRFVVELCQVKTLAGASSPEMVGAYNKLREVYRPSIDRDTNLEEVREPTT